jgi:hypothetical protein
MRQDVRTTTEHDFAKFFIVFLARSYCNIQGMRFLEFRAAASVSYAPSDPLTDLGQDARPLSVRHFFPTDIISLQTIVRQATRLPLPFAFLVRHRPVSEVLAIRSVV